MLWTKSVTRIKKRKKSWIADIVENKIKTLLLDEKLWNLRGISESAAAHQGINNIC